MPGAPGLYRVRQGDLLLLDFITSVATTLAATARLYYDDGTDDTLSIADNAGDAARTLSTYESGQRAREDGWVVGARFMCGAGTNRGQSYGVLYVAESAGSTAATVLASGYAYRGHYVALGEFGESGPGGGNGDRKIVSLAADIAPVDITYALALSNTLRKVTGYVIYYDAAAVAATRTIDVYLRGIGLALPTGFATAANTAVWIPDTLTLTTGEEGTMFARSDEGRDGFVMKNDNGTRAYANTTTAPQPFPLWVTEDDLATLFIDVGAAEATDRWSVYLFVEDWLVI